MPPRIARLASLVFCFALPVAVVVMIFVVTIVDGTVAMDFRQFYGAADAILRGVSPYPLPGEPLLPWGGPYPYPPLPALAATPLTVLSSDAAGLVVMSAARGRGAGHSVRPRRPRLAVLRRRCSSGRR